MARSLLLDVIEYVRGLASLISTHPQSLGLAQPVGALMRATNRIAPEDSLHLAASRLRENGASLLPVVGEDHRLRGVVTEASLARALVADVALTDSVMVAVVDAPTLHPYESCAEALRRFTELEWATLPVVDDQGRLMGLLGATDLYPRRRTPPMPPAVGGMATPFGVYLTTGAVSGGPKKHALVATGMVMGGLLVAGQALGWQASLFLDSQKATHGIANAASAILPLAIFLLGLRLIPMSGTHGAEHQVVHAIERGEELVPEVVSRMPRVHPRCGTNIAVGASLFLGIFLSNITPRFPELRLILAAVVTMLLWRRLGGVFQLFVTTKTPTPQQLERGIQSGRELLQNYSQSRSALPTVAMRIWNSGMLHVIAGSWIVLCAMYAVSKVLNVDLGLGTLW